ncbi:oligopeptide/dipeptide ABC transporter ATP-binding protein [Thalassobaculum sp.]|uniref:ABC transporter ATP-binding protein n=1 Tax=Thalassobaculum sp. TaxID=2022740 RepID=UPI0032EE30F0
MIAAAEREYDAPAREASAATVPLLAVEDLVKVYPAARAGLFGRRRSLTAVAGVSFELAAGETLAVVGESGCGKSTVGNLVLNLITPTAGRVRFDGEDLSAVDDACWRDRRRDMQLVFQDSRSALDPRLTVGAQVREGLDIHGIGMPAERRAEAEAMLEAVGLGGFADRYPHALSGGQQQRAVIARALVVGPRLVVCDEPVAALDVSIQAQVVNLLSDLQARLGLSYLFISHDLSLVRHVADRVAVMYLGAFVEVGTRRQIFDDPRHPYTRALIGAVPVARARRSRHGRPVRLTGEVPSPLTPPAGCSVHPRCPFATERCRVERPAARRQPDGRIVACHHPETVP